MGIRDRISELNSKVVLVIGIIVCLIGFAVFYLTSCGNTENLEAGAILDNAKLTVSDIKSAKIHMDIKYDLTTKVDDKSSDIVENMSCDVDTTSNPVIAHMKGIDELDYDGEKTESEVEVYSMESSGKNISYSSNIVLGDDDKKSEKSWFKNTSDATGGQLKAQMSLVATFSDNRDRFRVKKGEKVGKVRCHKVEGTLSSELLNEALKGMGDEDMSSILTVANASKEEPVEIKITAWFSRKTSRPVRIRMDLSKLMEKMLASENKENNTEFKVNEYVIDIRYSKFNKVGIISVPEEVIDSAMENIEKTPSNETLKKYLENVDLESIGLDVEDMDNWTEQDWQDAKDALYEYYGINSDTLEESK